MDPQETQIFTALIIAFIVIGTIFSFFTISIIRQQKRTLRLQKENALAEISAMEKERSRIAKDLHDDTGPVLSVIKFQIDSIETASDEEQQVLHKTIEQVDDLVARLREISFNLMPASLLRKGFVAAAYEFVQKIEKSGVFKTTFQNNSVSQLSQEKSINLFRIFQEVLHNAVKHSKAKNISVTINEDKKNISLLIKDDGKGFDFDTLLIESTGFGLRSLKNRAELMKGSMTVESKKGIGSAFLFEIPVEN